MNKSLGEAFPEEQARVRELLKTYYEIGPSGALAALLLEQVLQRADRAAISGDVAAMIVSFKEMQGCQ